MEHTERYGLHAAIALSAGNKARTEQPNGESVVVWEYAHKRYQIWIVGKNDQIWDGVRDEKFIDEMYEKFRVDPHQKVWISL